MRGRLRSRAQELPRKVEQIRSTGELQYNKCSGAHHKNCRDAESDQCRVHDEPGAEAERDEDTGLASMQRRLRQNKKIVGTWRKCQQGRS